MERTVYGLQNQASQEGAHEEMRVSMWAQSEVRE
jgi:hypothetical protein